MKSSISDIQYNQLRKVFPQLPSLYGIKEMRRKLLEKYSSQVQLIPNVGIIRTSIKEMMMEHLLTYDGFKEVYHIVKQWSPTFKCFFREKKKIIVQIPFIISLDGFKVTKKTSLIQICCSIPFKLDSDIEENWIVVGLFLPKENQYGVHQVVSLLLESINELFTSYFIFEKNEDFSGLDLRDIEKKQKIMEKKKIEFIDLTETTNQSDFLTSQEEDKSYSSQNFFQMKTEKELSLKQINSKKEQIVKSKTESSKEIFTDEGIEKIKFQLKPIFGGDLKMLHLLQGVSRYECPICWNKYRDTVIKKRQRKLKYKIPLIPDFSLHMVMRLVESIMLIYLKKLDQIHMKSVFLDYLSKYSLGKLVSRKNYLRFSVSGEQSRQFLQKIPDLEIKLPQLIKKHAKKIRRYSKEIKENMDRILEELKKIHKLSRIFGEIHYYCNYRGFFSEKQIKRITYLAETFQNIFSEIGQNNPHYLHILSCHLVPTAKKYRNISLWSQSTPELLNKSMRRIYNSVFTGKKSIIRNLKLALLTREIKNEQF